MSSPSESWSRPRLAILGFLGHAPGLKIVAGVRFNGGFVRTNLIAVGLTLAAMGGAGILAPPGARGLWVFVVWLALHFVWSTILSTWILRGEPFEPAR